MTRTDAIAIIAAALPKLDDELVSELAELVQSATEDTTTFRELTKSERKAVVTSRVDFKVGRTYTTDQYQDEMRAFIGQLSAKHPAA